jgi:sugar transferase (PEP-CTERM/EpsH1 system associated)
MPIRIMHVVDTLGKGGLENGLVNVIRGLDAERFQHIVCTMRGLGPNLERLPRERVEVVSLASENKGRLQTGTLARCIGRMKPDVVHSRNWGAVEAVVAARWKGCAVVHSEHGLEAGADTREPRRRIWFRRLAFELADRVLSVSYQLRDLHARRTGFAAEKITVVHNGVDTQRFRPDAAVRARARQELGIEEEEFCIGAVGNLLPVKDHMTLLRAVEMFASAAGKWRLLLIGEGSERAALTAFTGERSALRRQVTFLGSSDRVAELLNAMDVYVLPSLAEGISNALLEAMASGLPVIATNVGGNPEVVDRDSGLLFRAGDAGELAKHLQLLRTDRERRLDLAQAARRRIMAYFSIESMLRNYTGIYESAGRAPKGLLQATARV